MAYEYRRLTPQERETIIRQRIERRYPVHGPPHPYRHPGYYLITAATFEHKPIIADIERRTEFEIRLLSGLDNVQVDVFAWVVLPNHYHVLAGIDALEQLSTALKQLHGATSREWNIVDELTGKRRVWYQFNDRVIRNDPHFYSALNYIHYNPVKHGYVDSPYDWPWSSVHKYLEAHGREWLRAIWQAHPPLDFGDENAP